MGYYNTTNETGEALKDSQVKAETQTEQILTLFKYRPEGHYTPSEIHKLLQRLNCPLTSIRRGISDLTKDGKLERTGFKRKGIFGKPEFCWTLKKEEGQIRMFNQESLGI